MTLPSLTPDLQQRLQQTLAQWRQWRCDPPLDGRPESVAGLQQGLSNASIRVRAGRDFVVRLDRFSPRGLGLNRQGEWRVLQSASKAGIAPTPRYFNPELGCLVCDYLEPDNRPQQLDEVAQLLRAIHALPAVHHRLDLRERFMHYEKMLQHQHPGALDKAADCAESIALLHSASEPQPPLVMCHNDLLQANRLSSGGRLWALDWEYCAMGNPWFDLATIVTGDALDETQTRDLLQAWLQRPVQNADELQLLRQCCLAQYLEWLWYAAVRPQGMTADAQAARLQRLRSLLRRVPEFKA